MTWVLEWSKTEARVGLVTATLLPSHSLPGMVNWLGRIETDNRNLGFLSHHKKSSWWLAFKPNNNFSKDIIILYISS